jgi:hypothetical protein
VADWLDLGPGYVAVDYTLRSVAGYLRMRADRDLVMIVIGDHQPAAAVSESVPRGMYPSTSSPAARAAGQPPGARLR